MCGDRADARVHDMRTTATPPNAPDERAAILQIGTRSAPALLRTDSLYFLALVTDKVRVGASLAPW